jgi:iron complex outermembrane receptor protein
MVTISVGSRISLAALVLVLAVEPVQAQIDEIVVTSRRIEESLNDVPLSITAFTSEEIESAFIRNLDDVANLTPGLSFFNAQGEFLPVPVIRGVAPTDIFGENNAAIFVDGVFISGREGLNFSQLDVERIEVVKGPQSALYGRNAFSGAINYITKRPTDEFSSKAEVIAGNDGRLSGQVFVSGPLIGDKLRGRAALLYDDFDGSYENTFGSEDIGGYEFKSGQLGLSWTPTDTFEVYGSMYFSDDSIDDAAQSAIAANCEERGDGRLQNVCGALPGINGEGIPKIPGADGEQRELIRGNLNIDWDLDVGTISLLTGYSETKQSARVDGNRGEGDSLPFLYCTVPFGIPGFCALPGAPGEQAFFESGLLQIEWEDKTTELSQEIRFTSPQDQRLRYTAGGYYYDVEAIGGDGGVVATNQDLPANLIGFAPYIEVFPPVGFLPLGSSIVFDDWFSPGGDLDPLQRPVAKNTEEAWALFTGIDYDLTEVLTARFELRYTDVEKESTLTVWNEDDLTQVAPDNVRGGQVQSDLWTGRIGLDMQLTDNWMVYGYVAKGAKPGGVTFFDAAVAVPDEPACDGTGGIWDGDDLTCQVLRSVPFDPEEIITYELGLKGQTADGRVGLNLALYVNDWSDIVLRQTVEFDPISGLPLDQPEAVNVNAADSKYFGFEIDTNILITDNFTSRFSLAYADATIDNARQDTYETFPSFAPDGDVSGNSLLRRPKWQATATLNYARTITGDWEFYTRGDWSWQDEIFIGNDNQSWLPDRSIVNGAIGIRSGRYTLELWGRNLLDDDTPSSAYRDPFFTNTDDITQQFPPGSTPGAGTFADFFPIRYSVSHPRLRTFGLTARVRFGGEVR